MFVVRVAGNIAAPTQIGSIQFAALQLGARLVVILGHSRCGAIISTLSQLRDGSSSGSPQLDSIVDLIRPALASLSSTEATGNGGRMIRDAVRANIDFWSRRLQADESLQRLIQEAGLVIIGAEYCLETGHVEFLDAGGSR